ncbi:U4/U6.U5 tri-snRNP-associated protein 1 [Dioscorea alata]|uniref:U4/U6.U5 tri-snRNP-associated protein 1 n=1 Tax=Dioscorea alata TaxID=55571 RepID=A0ACB7VW31_DIOAL|nr:U4/U6.U5 tri-snRNP-associated protein 1 [Dioscorea alata]
MEVDGEDRFRSSSVERGGRDGRAGDNEENGSVDQDCDAELGRKDKSRESGKHKSKDRKRRREEKEHSSWDRDRDRSKEREREDRLESRERRKDDREYDKDREKDKVREKDHDRDIHRGKERDRDTERFHDEENDRGKARESDRGRERKVDRDRDLPREYERDKNRERDRDGDKGHDRSKGRDKDHGKENERELERERGKDKDRDRGKEKEREREKDRDRVKDREREKEKEKSKDREKGKDREKEGDRDKLERIKIKDRAREKETDKETDRDRSRAKDKEREMDRSKDGQKDEKITAEDGDGRTILRSGDGAQDEHGTHERIASRDSGEKSSGLPDASSGLGERLMKMREERHKRKSDGSSEISAWVSKSRKLEENRNAEKEKAVRLSKILDEQESILAESDDEDAAGHSGKDLAGVKILHGLDKVMEGGAVVLTLKDQDILAGGDLNEDVDMLENVEIGEQKRRDEAYKAAKKTTGIYFDKFNDDTGTQRPILPQYDDPVEDEGVTLDESGRFAGEAEKKLEELRRRIEGGLTRKNYEDLTTTGKSSSDFYSPEEMLQFKKPKKKKSLRKKDKLDLDALEAEAISAGLGAGDLGSRNDAKRQAAKEEKERSEAASRSNAYQTAYAKAEEASKVLRQGQPLTSKASEEDDLVFGEDYEDLQKSLEQSRKLALKKQEEAAASGPQAVALLAVANREQSEIHSPAAEPQENKVVITEMEEFVLGLQMNEESHKPESDSVFMDEDDGMKSSELEVKDTGGGGLEDLEETADGELQDNEEKEDITPDEIIHETAVGKGLSGALKLLKERGTLKEDIDWGGRNMDKKKSKLVGINDNAGPKEIRIERLDEFGRIMTPKEAFRMISHKFHGKGPGKMKQEKRMKNYQMDLQTKQMKASDTPSQAMERMREAQARLKTPYLVLSGHVKPGQTSDPRSGFATVEKDHLGSLTPMLGDKKVEHFLGITRKSDSGSMGPPPPRKPKN